MGQIKNAKKFRIIMTMKNSILLYGYTCKQVVKLCGLEGKQRIPQGIKTGMCVCVIWTVTVRHKVSFVVKLGT